MSEMHPAITEHHVTDMSVTMLFACLTRPQRAVIFREVMKKVADAGWRGHIYTLLAAEVLPYARSEVQQVQQDPNAVS